MTKYTRTQQVEAIKWKGDNEEAIKRLVGEFIKDSHHKDFFRIYRGCYIKGKEIPLEIHYGDTLSISVYLNQWLVIYDGLDVVSDMCFKSEFVEKGKMRLRLNP